MTKEMKLLALQNRYNLLMSRGDKNLKSAGVAKKVLRQIRNLQEIE